MQNFEADNFIFSTIFEKYIEKGKINCSNFLAKKKIIIFYNFLSPFFSYSDLITSLNREKFRLKWCKAEVCIFE